MNNRAIFLLLFLALVWPSRALSQIHMTIQQAQTRLNELKALKISKDEFETTDEFKAREARLYVERRNQIDALLDQSYPGTAQVVMGLYDADNEIYPAQLWLAGFSEKLIFKVPRAEAKLVKENSSLIMATGRFWLEYEGGVFLIGKLAIKITGKEYFSEPGRNRLAIVKEGGVDTYEQHYSAVFSPDGKWLATAGVDGVNLWDTRGKKVRVLSEGRGDFVVFSPDGKWIAATLWSESGLEIVTKLKIWNAGDMQLIRTISLGGMLDGDAAAFSPDGKWLAIGAAVRDAVVEAFLNKSAKKGYLKILAVPSGEEVRSLPLIAGHEGICALAFSPNGRWLSSGEYGAMLRLWEIPTGKEINRFSLEGRDCIRAVAFAPNENWLCGADNNMPTLWDVTTGQKVRQIQGDSYSLTFSPDGKWLASRTLNHFMISDVASGRALREFNWNVSSLAFSPDGQWLATAQSGGTALYKIKEMK
jgi:hypothetical protein